MQESLSSRDKRTIWHPYTQHGLGRDILPVVSAKGAYLTLENGSLVLDGISSWWVNLHGHCHPRIAKAISDQALKMEHVIFAGFTHEPAVRLAEQLIEGANKSGGKFARAFFSDNGSTAVEASLKMAFQYHLNRGDTQRSRFLALRSAYHGDTFGAMAVGEPTGFHAQFRSLLPQVDFVEPDDLEVLRCLLNEQGSFYAAFIFEPLIQAAAGMKLYSPEFLKTAVQLCKEKGLITISDEVFTGFFRTGTCFAFERANISPDLLCLSKGISGGFLPLAVTLASRELYEAFLSSDVRSAFLHGHSYTANPIACAAALASWELLHEKATKDRIEAIMKRTSEHILRMGSHFPGAKKVRSIGTIGVVELASDRDYFHPSGSSIFERAISKGVLIRPLGNVLYAVPPYCCTDEEIDRIYEVIEEIAYEVQ
jgi:adenosylmethionine-8-amino-7-oxononanoate aminotransferase